MMFVSRFSRSVASAATARRLYASSSTLSAKAAFPAPRLFDYETVTSNLNVADAIESVEAAFGALAQGKVDVPMPMHIGIDETENAGPGDCHISKFSCVLVVTTTTTTMMMVFCYVSTRLLTK